MPKIFVKSLVNNYIDSTVLQDIIKTHAKESITLVPYGNVNISNVPNDLIKKVQFSETEISSFHKYDIDCNSFPSPPVSRRASLNSFSQKKISFEDLQKWLIKCFSPDDHGRRPYPSAGGLYPIEPLVFLFPERIEGFSHIPGCYHFRSLGKKLQLIKTMQKEFFFDKILHNLISQNAQPCFSILYLAAIEKAIFKYRYRGYRHALMEAGAMYQHATHTFEGAGLRTTVWSSFGDQQLMYALDLDHSSYIPLTLQFFGYGD
ncbi:SagB/ThcOx family dehydrogenase [Legionella gresilensis]|uniref:SagB/ThcOx family dehydrogenase n=1 Tax=Legionella gresilensis TaxID=91823 RepID=UPI0013EFB1AE|nr:SagB/ThcOx family dehydrogenase [Legionella gresilensis]